MDRLLLEAEPRPDINRGRRNQLRQEDKVLAVVYGRGKETQALVVDGRPLRQVLSSGGSNVLIELKVKQKGKKTLQETVMFKEIQRHIIHKDRLLHVDFIRISMTDKIDVSVHLNFIGDPVGVEEGGVLQLLTREVMLKCLPGDIPEAIDVDLSGLAIGDSITADSIQIGEDVELITLPEEPLAQVLAPVMEEEEPAEEEAEEAEEGAEAADEAADAPADEES